MSNPEVIDRPAPGCWYSSNRHLPPIGSSVLVTNRDLRCWMVDSIHNEHTRSLIFTKDLAWQVPALPIDLFFELESAPGQRQKFPMDMILPRFKGFLLRDIVDTVLAEAGRALTTKELTASIYQTNSDEEFSRVRNSLSTELRQGVDRSAPTWRKIGRNAYEAIGGGDE